MAPIRLRQNKDQTPTTLCECVISIGSLGLGFGGSLRSDLNTEYSQLITRVGKFSADTVTIAINNK
ncbi:hypothetical protein GH741_12985 [Aquibacillus halophilus]|uniref:Uncharacterized protein n=1 Tax=Aquibacillus halophilus TaxID=930132 RepID=A0A6A8DGC1_9BACI|nr:hypothetical protein [Aquibacillus halophilus]MRH43596.1 hypothetical protein [Aquibacillus halophilus]